MTAPTGHESGHSLADAVRGWTWADVVDALVAERGSLAELARHLMDVAPASAKLSSDPGTVERGLRRLRSRGSREGNRYGRLVLRCFVAPDAMTRELRAMGQYHSRASDLAVEARRERLVRWDRPPVTESPAAIWLHLAIATAAHQRGDHDEVARRVQLVRLLVQQAEPMARLEALLFFARLDADGGDRPAAETRLDAAETILAGDDLPASDRACYLARTVDQRAYLDPRPPADDGSGLARSLARYDAIPDSGDAPAFARFRRAHGRAWCLWRLGRTDEALASVRRAIEHAGDGGYVRFRAMALVLAAHIVGEGRERRVFAQRAMVMARRLGDVALERSAARAAR